MIERKVKSVRALERGLDVLLEIQQRRASSLHDLHLATGLPKATLLRMLVTLSGRGLIWQRLADGAYLPAALPAADHDLDRRLAEIASPELARLSRRIAWPSVIGVPRADHIEIVETNSPMARLDAATLGPVGVKLSYIHTAVGRAYLAACEDQERARIIARVRPEDASPASEAQLDAIIAETQQRGWSSRDPSHPWPDRSRINVIRDGRRSIAVAVRIGGRPVAAINITWPGRRSTYAEIVERHLPALVETAQTVAARAEGAVVAHA
ncbi:helix-turn-helix domain-containing protein [Sphingomonas sp. MMS24-J13]|uniref:IclR family transcriptional regulator domain-containing protein n=1 Tax=Sphingomonas sp. MMS24-J13 TaxID=3238686 RepID=UPI00384CD220